ncbi:hypothetical protein CW751_02720 [Brumimicrobium salinarum]|uniref:DUF2141 domain-containing protein n=1 Tax=Brumimicrobium salinarum TaxID=2058658 RepID=A0A2I0R6Q4_9FLAO|nr:DUF2141 domain-containing protein [Brumimicrobium salinarum]PKR82262.1 hypothetical protein CW751_02720 [Brumimicrobium salinarum]
MRNTLIILLFSFLVFTVIGQSENYYELKVVVKELRNNTGVVQFALYNEKGSIPDEDFEKYFKIGKSAIKNNKAEHTFKGLKSGTYAINILHDENINGKIDKGWVLPIEGIGFSNFKSIGLTNRPNFERASFQLNENKELEVKIIYM